MPEVRIPEVGASPLLNRKVIEKPLSEPIFNQAPQPQPEQARSAPEPQPTPQPQPQPQPGIDPSMEHLSPPNPMDDPNLREMDYDFGNQDGGQGDDEGGHESGGKSEFKLPKAEAREFAGTIVQIGAMYVPQFLSKLATIDLTELQLAERQNAVPPGTVAFFREINQNTEAALRLTKEEIEMLESALQAYLEWKAIEAANPGTALALSLGAVGLRLTITTVTAMRQNRAMYKNFLEEIRGKMPPQQPQTETPKS